MSRPVITEPGLYPDVDEDWYHADPVEGGSLSVSGAKLLVPPSPAAKFKWARDNPRPPSRAQKLGMLAHALTLGTPVGDIALLDFKDRTRTKAFNAAEKEALDAGKRVVLVKEWDEAQAIAGALRSHPTAGGLLADGDSEVSMFWRDREFGIWQRGRMDHFALSWQMPTIVDLKTSKDASEESFAKSVYDYGYHRQDVNYREGLAACLGCEPDEVDMVFVVVETEPPYLVAHYRVSARDADLGRQQMRAARERYRDCTESGRWPGYSEEIEDLELPAYARRQIEQELNDWYR